MVNEIVIVINPGSTSTKVALYNCNGEVNSISIKHSQSDLDKFNRITDQFDFRYYAVKDVVFEMLMQNNYEIVDVVGRGGIVKPLSGGTYRINKAFIEDAGSFEKKIVLILSILLVMTVTFNSSTLQFSHYKNTRENRK